MKPPPFDYVCVGSADEAVALLGEHGDDARVLAGGQSLMALLNMRLANPRLLIDISRAPDLDYVSAAGTLAAGAAGPLAVGAAVTQAAVEWRPHLAEEVPLLAQAFPHLGHFQTRNRGTVCGSIAHADPSAELPLVLTVLNGDAVLRSVKGRRVVKGEDFFTGMLATARAPDELLEEVRFPWAAPGTRYGFTEVGMRHGDFAIVALAVAVSRSALRFGVGGVGGRPVAVDWPRLAGSALEDALNQLAWTLDAQDDHHASAQYRRHLVRTLGKRLVEELS